MGKNSTKNAVPTVTKPFQMNFKKNNKHLAKLKDKLKSAISNQKNSDNQNLLTDAKAHKFGKHPSKTAANSVKPTVSAVVVNNSAKITNNLKPSSSSVNGIGKQSANVDQKELNSNVTINKKTSEKREESNSLKKPNITSVETNQNPKKNKKKKKKMKNANKEQQKSLPKPSDTQSEAVKRDRNFEKGKPNETLAKKRFKTVGGFVESNANDEIETQLVKEKLKKRKKKKSKDRVNEDAKQNGTAPTDRGPSVKVHSVDENHKNSLTNSDSEADSYIDKFFGDNDETFDENRIFSLNELEAKNANFLAKASGDVTNANEDASSEASPIEISDSDNDSMIMKNKSKRLSQLKKTVPKNNQLVNFKQKEQEHDYDSDEFWLVDNSDDSGTSSDDDNMFYGSDSDISLGSEVDSDDFDDTYEYKSGDDNESMDEDEVDTSSNELNDFPMTSDSNDSGDNFSDSASSEDTYEEFMHRRHYDSDRSSNDDHDYYAKNYDDIRIAAGTAVTHRITDKRIKIFENDTESRILEMPKSDSDDNSCVELVPIDVSRKKLMRIHQEKLIAKQHQLNEEKEREERKRLAYEKSVADYYNMNNLNKTSSHVPNDQLTKPVTIIKCSKNMSQLTLDWLDDSDDTEQSSMEDYDTTFSKSKVSNAIVTSIPVSNKSQPVTVESHAPSESKNATEMNSIAAEEISETETSDTAEITDPVEEDASMQITPPSKSMEPQFFNSLHSRHVLLLLRHKLHFHGSLHVKLIAGKANTVGYELQTNQTVTLHSPRSHSLIALIPYPSSASNKKYLQLLDGLKEEFYLQDIEYLKKEFNCTTDAILLLERDQTNKGVNMIDRYMRETVFPNINAFNNESPFYSSEFVLHCKFLHEPDNGLMFNEQWNTINLEANTKLVTIGGKGVGKSTFIRYLINSNFHKFQKFLFIDLDIGQPELFVPQTLSATLITQPMLGPGYLQNVKPSKAVLFGDINVLPDPIKYFRCVLDIFEFCSRQSEWSAIPLIVNTMGYSRGFGSELIACILKLMQPSDLVQIQSRLRSDNFDQIMDADTVNRFKFNVFADEMKNIDRMGRSNYKMHVFEAWRGGNKPKHTAGITAKDLRYTMILAKLGNCLKSNSDWLTSVKPFEASLNDLQVLITSGEEINSDDHLDLLNGNLVYLCEKSAKNLNGIVDCHGIGIVRGVDAATNKVYLLSTIPLTELRHVNVLAIGTIPLPSAVFLNQHTQVRGTVPFVYNSDNFVGSKQVAQHIYRAECKTPNKPIQLMED